MPGLEGTLNTPFGDVSKKTAVLVGGGLALVLVVVWMRSKKQSQDALAAAGSSEINPATGFPYGSPEDAAALTAQGNYQFPTGGSVGGSGGGSGGIGSGFVNNAEWVQAVVTYMTDRDLVAEPSQLTTALGKYITGQPAGDDATRTLIEQAIAVQGYPPVSGANGYPPSINTNHPPETPPTQPPSGSSPIPGPAWINVFKGQGVRDFVGVVNSFGNPIGWDGLKALNPQIESWIAWDAHGDRNKDTFKFNTAVRVK